MFNERCDDLWPRKDIKSRWRDEITKQNESHCRAELNNKKRIRIPEGRSTKIWRQRPTFSAQHVRTCSWFNLGDSLAFKFQLASTRPQWKESIIITPWSTRVFTYRYEVYNNSTHMFTKTRKASIKMDGRCCFFWKEITKKKKKTFGLISGRTEINYV